MPIGELCKEKQLASNMKTNFSIKWIMELGFLKFSSLHEPKKYL